MMTDLDQLAALAAAVKTAHARHAAATRRRDDAIRAALAAGISATQLVQTLGLNRARIYQIRDAGMRREARDR